MSGVVVVVLCSLASFAIGVVLGAILYGGSR